MKDLEKIYSRRFKEDIVVRNKIYEVLCRNFFQKYVPKDATILEIAAGYCELINNIKAKKKIALDINPDIKKYANINVKVIVSASTKINQIKNETVDIVFVNNFFEHLSKEDIIKTIKESHRVLKYGANF